jgi:hypothetical protein
VASCDFDGETEVDLKIYKGEKLVSFDGVEAPAGWLIVEQVEDADSEEGRRKGLVPQGFVDVYKEGGARVPDVPEEEREQLAEEKRNKEKAAAVLQARHRGRFGRRQSDALRREKNEKEREKAAIRLQARQRGRATRKRITRKVNGLLPAALYGLD